MINKEMNEIEITTLSEKNNKMNTGWSHVPAAQCISYGLLAIAQSIVYLAKTLKENKESNID